MKLFYITSARIPDEWAHVFQILTMCEAFAHAGAAVTLIAPHRAKTSPEDPYTFGGVEKNFAIEKFPCVDLFAGTQSQFFYWIRSLSYMLFLMPYLLGIGSVPIYTRDPLLVLLGRILGKDVTWEIHTANKSLFTRMAVKRATRIIAISKGLQEFCVSLGVSREKVFVENDGVRLEAFANIPTKETLRTEFGIDRDAEVIAYVGKYKTMGEAKGVDGLIEAMVQIVHEMPHALLMIVGLYPHEVGEVQQYARTAGLLDHQYKLVSHVPKVQVPLYLCASDILVMNYPNTEHYAHIMSPLKMYEYMASGVPIVSSDLPTIREALTEKSACLVTPDDTTALAHGILKVLGDDTYARNISHRARTEVEAHTWKARAERILKLV